MRKHVLTLSLLALLAACDSAGTLAPNARDNNASASSPTPANDAMPGASATFIVHGMGCPMCANNIDKQLLRVQGVQDVNIDLGTGQVAIKFASGAHPSRKRLVDAVEHSGFSLVEIRQP